MARKFILLFIITLIHEASAAQIKFTHATYDFGTFAEDMVRLPQCEFEFINNGKHPVPVIKINTSCGCLKATFDPQPVNAGKTGIIRIIFDPKGHPGNFLRKLTVYFSRQSRPCILQVKGTVRPAQKPPGQQTYLHRMKVSVKPLH